MYYHLSDTHILERKNRLVIIDCSFSLIYQYIIAKNWFLFTSMLYAESNLKFFFLLSCILICSNASIGIFRWNNRSRLKTKIYKSPTKFLFELVRDQPFTTTQFFFVHTQWLIKLKKFDWFLFHLHLIWIIMNYTVSRILGKIWTSSKAVYFEFIMCDVCYNGFLIFQLRQYNHFYWILQYVKWLAECCILLMISSSWCDFCSENKFETLLIPLEFKNKK